MKKYLLITLMAIALSATAQQTPTNKTRSNSDYSQVDNYLIGLKRLGIPTSETDNLDAAGLPQNTVKLIYNTTLGRLRIYNPLTATWSDASEVDLSGYIQANPSNAQLASIALNGDIALTNGHSMALYNGSDQTETGERAVWTNRFLKMINSSNSAFFDVTEGHLKHTGSLEINGQTDLYGHLWVNQMDENTSGSDFDIAVRNRTNGNLDKVSFNNFPFLPLTGGTVTGELNLPSLESANSDDHYDLKGFLLGFDNTTDRVKKRNVNDFIWNANSSYNSIQQNASVKVSGEIRTEADLYVAGKSQISGMNFSYDGNHNIDFSNSGSGVLKAGNLVFQSDASGLDVTNMEINSFQNKMTIGMPTYFNEKIYPLLYNPINLTNNLTVLTRNEETGEMAQLPKTSFLSSSDGTVAKFFGADDRTLPVGGLYIDRPNIDNGFGAFLTVGTDGYTRVLNKNQVDINSWGGLKTGDTFSTVQGGTIAGVLGKDTDGNAYLYNPIAVKNFLGLNYLIPNNTDVLHKTLDETKKGRLILSNEGDANPVYLAVQDYNTGYGINAGSNGVMSLRGDKETDQFGGLTIQNYNSKGNAPIFLNSGANTALINFTSEDYFPNENNQLQFRNFSVGSDASVVFKTVANSFQLNNNSFQITNLEEKVDDSFAPLLAYVPSNGHIKKIEDNISLRPNAINSSALGTATTIRVVPIEGRSQVGARHEIGFSSWNTHGTTQYGIGGRVTDVSGNEYSDMYLYNNGAERLIVGSDGKVSVPNDVEITDLTKGIIMKSPNGTRYRVTINDAGDFVKTAL